MQKRRKAQGEKRRERMRRGRSQEEEEEITYDNCNKFFFLVCYDFFLTFCMERVKE